jgi:hypothetical protein
MMNFANTLSVNFFFVLNLKLVNITNSVIEINISTFYVLIRLLINEQFLMQLHFVKLLLTSFLNRD